MVIFCMDLKIKIGKMEYSTDNNHNKKADEIELKGLHCVQYEIKCMHRSPNHLINIG